MDYKVIKGTSQENLEKKVKEHFEKGYELQGGIAYCSSNYVFFQAMFKKDKTIFLGPR